MTQPGRRLSFPTRSEPDNVVAGYGDNPASQNAKRRFSLPKKLKFNRSCSVPLDRAEAQDDTLINYVVDTRFTAINSDSLDDSDDDDVFFVPTVGKQQQGRVVKTNSGEFNEEKVDLSGLVTNQDFIRLKKNDPFLFYSIPEVQRRSLRITDDCDFAKFDDEEEENAGSADTAVVKQDKKENNNLATNVAVMTKTTTTTATTPVNNHNNSNPKPRRRSSLVPTKSCPAGMLANAEIRHSLFSNSESPIVSRNRRLSTEGHSSMIIDERMKNADMKRTDSSMSMTIMSRASTSFSRSSIGESKCSRVSFLMDSCADMEEDEILDAYLDGEFDEDSTTGDADHCNNEDDDSISEEFLNMVLKRVSVRGSLAGVE